MYGWWDPNIELPTFAKVGGCSFLLSAILLQFPTAVLGFSQKTKDQVIKYNGVNLCLLRRTKPANHMFKAYQSCKLKHISQLDVARQILFTLLPI